MPTSLTTTRLAFCAVTALTLAGCTSAPDRSDEAAALESSLRNIVGVTSASTSYERGGSRGASMLVDVSLPTATNEQIAAMVQQMDTRMGTDFDRYYVTVTVSLGSGIQLTSVGKMQPTTTARDVALARRLQNSVHAQRMELAQSSSGPHLTIDGAADTTSAVEAAAAAAGPTPAAIEVNPTASDGQVVWDITTPIPQAQLHRIADTITRLPAPAFLVAVDSGEVTKLSVSLTETRSRARDTLRSIISQLGAGPVRPLALNWNLGTPTANAERYAGGSVSVGHCDYPDSAGETDPHKFLTADALTLQQQMRTDYDTCRK